MRDGHDPFSSFYRLRKPCANCPFLKEGAIELRPGRLEGIIKGLLRDDSQTFNCHKTLNRSEDLDEELDHSGNPRRIKDGEKMCAGAAAYLLKVGRPSVGMRYARITGSISSDHWDSAQDLIIDPIE